MWICRDSEALFVLFADDEKPQYEGPCPECGSDKSGWTGKRSLIVEASRMERLFPQLWPSIKDMEPGEGPKPVHLLLLPDPPMTEGQLTKLTEGIAKEIGL